MRRNAQIRAEFKSKFSAIAGAERVAIVEEWFKPLWEEDSIIASWISRSQMRVMRVQEADKGETLQFAYAIGKAGEKLEYDDVFVQAVSSDQKVNEILDIYRHWFVELLSPKRMDSLLQTYADKFQNGALY